MKRKDSNCIAWILSDQEEAATASNFSEYTIHMSRSLKKKDSSFAKWYRNGPKITSVFGPPGIGGYLLDFIGNINYSKDVSEKVQFVYLYKLRQDIVKFKMLNLFSGTLYCSVNYIP